jgi:hypothetical protein
MTSTDGHFRGKSLQVKDFVTEITVNPADSSLKTGTRCFEFKIQHFIADAQTKFVIPETGPTKVNNTNTLHDITV